MKKTYAPNGKNYNRRRKTQYEQREAIGKRLHPRGLARSVAKFINRSTDQKESELWNWRNDVMKLPKKLKPKQKLELARK